MPHPRASTHPKAGLRRCRKLSQPGFLYATTELIDILINTNHTHPSTNLHNKHDCQNREGTRIIALEKYDNSKKICDICESILSPPHLVLICEQKIVVEICVKK